MLFRHYYLMRSSLDVVRGRSSEDEDIVRDLAYLEENVVIRKEAPLAFVRRGVWGVLYAGYAGNISKSVEALAKQMTMIVTVCEEPGLAVS